MSERAALETEEIEITPAMIEAGSLVVASFFDEVVAYGSGISIETAKQVYLAMRRACGDDPKSSA
jgi:hypothetical protein